MRRLTFLLTFITSVILTTSTDAAQNPIGQTEITTNRNCTPTPTEYEIIALKEAGQRVPEELYQQLRRNHKPHDDMPVLQRQGGDTIEEAVPVELGTTVTGTTVGYIDDYDEECTHLLVAPDVVYSITVAEDTGLYLHFEDSDYNQYLFIYDESLNLVGCRSNHLQLGLLADRNYYIIVDGRSGASGNYVLEISELDCEPLECEGIAEIEDNGGCNANPEQFQEITLGDTICGTTWCYEGDWDEDWYEFNVPEFCQITLLLDSYNFDPKIELISDPAGDCSGSVLYIQDDGYFCEPETLSTYLEAGHYYILVHQNTHSTFVFEGNYNLTITGAPTQPEEGEYCEGPIQIQSIPYYTEDRTTDNIDTWGNPSPDEWYYFNLLEPGDIRISLDTGHCSDYDTYLWLLTDDCETVIAYNDDS